LTSCSFRRHYELVYEKERKPMWNYSLIFLVNSSLITDWIISAKKFLKKDLFFFLVGSGMKFFEISVETGIIRFKILGVAVTRCCLVFFWFFWFFCSTDGWIICLSCLLLVPALGSFFLLFCFEVSGVFFCFLFVLGFFFLLEPFSTSE
jgi:hypothetical protein